MATEQPFKEKQTNSGGPETLLLSHLGQGLTPSPTSHPPPDQLSTSSPGQVSGHLAWAGVGALGGANNRTFEQIIEHEKKNRHIIEINISKNTQKILKRIQTDL